MPYDEFKAGDPRRSSDGRLTFPITCASTSDVTLKPVTRTFDAAGATKPYKDWLRGKAIELHAELNVGVEFLADVADILNVPLDVTTPIEKPQPSGDDLALQAFIELVKAVQAAKAKLLAVLAIKGSTQEEIDAATAAVDASWAAVKQAYAPKGTPISPELAKRFDEALAVLKP